MLKQMKPLSSGPIAKIRAISAKNLAGKKKTKFRKSMANNAPATMPKALAVLG